MENNSRQQVVFAAPDPGLKNLEEMPKSENMVLVSSLLNELEIREFENKGAFCTAIVEESPYPVQLDDMVPETTQFVRDQDERLVLVPGVRGG